MVGVTGLGSRVDSAVSGESGFDSAGCVGDVSSDTGTPVKDDCYVIDIRLVGCYSASTVAMLVVC